jgi:signal peptide peptidase-like protein 2B
VEVAAAAADGSGAQLTVYGYPAAFGPTLNASIPWALELAAPVDACGGAVATAAAPGAAALVLRGNCTFFDKLQALQAAGYGAIILYANGIDDECVVMSAAANDTSGPLDTQVAGVSLTSRAGAALQALLLQQQQQGGVSVTLRQVQQRKFDAAAALLWAMAVATVAGGALWGGADMLHAAHGGFSSGAGGDAEGGGSPVAEITPRAAAAFAFASSALLLFLYFLAGDWVALALALMYCVAAWQSTTLVLLSIMNRVAPPAWRAAALRLPRGGATPALPAAAAAAAAGLAGAWLAFRGAHWAWALQDALSVSVLLLLLRSVHLPSLRVACILLPAAMAYDVFWVFLQPLVTGGASVMVEVAAGGGGRPSLPMVLEVPQLGVPGSNPAVEILGLGDVALPGLLVALALRWDLRAGLGLRRGYFLPAAASYGAGLAVTYAALALSWFGDQGQPALLYLCPAVLGTVGALGRWRGDLPAMWAGDFGDGGGGRSNSRVWSDASDGLEAGQGEAESLLP